MSRDPYQEDIHLCAAAVSVSSVEGDIRKDSEASQITSILTVWCSTMSFCFCWKEGRAGRFSHRAGTGEQQAIPLDTLSLARV